LALRITHKRIPLYITLEYSIDSKHWDQETQTISSSCKKYKNLSRVNNSIQRSRIDADEIIDVLDVTGELDRISAAELKGKILNKSARVTVSSFTKVIIEQLKFAKQLGNASVYEQALSFLERHSGTPDITFDELNFSVIKKLEAGHLAEGNSLNSLSFYLRTIRAIFNRAIKAGVVKRDTYPFSNYSIKETKTVKRAISKVDIEKIINLSLPPDTPKWHSRNYFLFSFYNMGMNFMDIALLKRSNILGDRLEYTRAKTGKNYSIKLQGHAMEILTLYLKDQEPDDFIFPIIKRTGLAPQLMDIQNERKKNNTYLKKIAGSCEIKSNLTSYVARHSWATIAKNLNVPVSVISEGLGHEDIKTTQIYLDSFETSVIDDANKLITG
jgi:integrase/recombinase XerD